MSDTALVERPKIGRPCEYTEEMGERVYQALAGGLPVRRFRERDDLPDPSTLYEWSDKIPAFAERFARGRKALADHYAFTGLDRLESVDPDSDYGSQRVSKARDTAGHMRWLAGCLDRDTYGDKQQLQVTANIAVTAFLDMARPEAKAIIDVAALPHVAPAQVAYEDDQGE